MHNHKLSPSLDRQPTLNILPAEIRPPRPSIPCRRAWQTLGDMPATEAKQQFYTLLLETAAPFGSWLDDRLAEKREDERREAAEKAEAERQMHQAAAAAMQQHQQLEARRQAELRALQAQQRAQELAAEKERRRQQQAQALGLANLAELNSPAVKEQLRSAAYVANFRKTLQGNEQHDVVVKSGEVLTIRVPKPNKANVQMMWQFNTQDYDLAFGVDFESMNPDGSLNIEVVLPTARCSSNAEVVTGTHVTALAGTWLLKFDNAFSYFRSKRLFYRVMCSGVDA